MKKEIFKVGDRVYHIEYGWGVVTEINTSYRYGIEVEFDHPSLNCAVSYTFDGKEFESSNTSLLSFTEYTLQGFSQERPIVLPEVGELCLVCDRGIHDTDYIIREFIRYDKDSESFICKSQNNEFNEYSWKKLKRIKILD